MSTSIRALLFDVFGTVVDWRSSVIAEGRALGEREALDGVDWEAFADRWRGKYQPSMERVRSGAREWVLLDTLHRESLCELLDELGIAGLTDKAIDELNLAWHRLAPWPDSPPGLARLASRHHLVTCSNGNVTLLADLARHGNLPFDAILGPSVTHTFKPQPGAYLGTAALLGLEPSACMMVAAHNDDLRHAASLGLRTAFVARPDEHGPGQRRDLEPEGDWDYSATSMLDLADQLGC